MQSTQSRVRNLAIYGGSGASSAMAAYFATGAKAIGMIGKVSVGAKAMPVFLVAGVVGGLAVLGVRSVFGGKRRRY